MNRTLLILALGGLSLSVSAQSKFTVGNSGSTLILLATQDGNVPIQSTPAMGGDYFAALYLGPAGAPDRALVKSSRDAKIGITPALAGIFSLGTLTIAGLDAGVEVQAQIRAWRASDPFISGANQSKTFSSKISPPVVLMGTGANQLGGFVVILPEPNAVVLFTAGLAGLCWMRRRVQ